MIIWSGLGFLVPIFGMVALVIASAAWGGQGESPYPFMVAAALAAVPTWFVGRRLNDPAKDRELQDPATGEAVRVSHRATFFFINMEWWAIAFLVLVPVALVVYGDW